MNLSFVVCDSPKKYQFSFQDPASPLATGIVDLHHDICFFLIIISIFVLYLLLRVVVLFRASENNFAKIVHGKVIEIVWTILPAVILAVIALPSFALLYSMDEILEPAVTIKATGMQWAWRYEFSDYNECISFDSYLVAEDELTVGDLRLLEVDNPIYLPVNTHVRVLITSDDVLHSWTVPSFGVKADACPGRLNQASIFAQRVGVFYGQCSEICGVNHGFMPICVKIVSLQDYIDWIALQLEE